MTVLLSFIGLALAALAFVVSARMTRDSRFVDRLGAAVAGGTGLLVLVAATLRPDLLWLSLGCLVLLAAAVLVRDLCGKFFQNRRRNRA